MKNFVWERANHYPYPGPDFYTSDKIQFGLDYQAMYCQAKLEVRVNGPKTAYSSISFSVEWSSNLHHGVTLHRHFAGSHASQSARAWCQYLLNNPPNNWNQWERKP